jgi:putative tricarboxylic transport membrane protein
MRRDTFLKSLAAMAAAGALPLPAWANANLKMMIPANPGGGWDITGRALGKALSESGAAATVTYDNKGGAAGAIGLAQFVNSTKGDPNAMMVMGAVMLGGIITSKPPVQLSQATPIARLSSEYNVFVLPASSPLKTMKDVVEQLKKDPGSVKWGGGSRGSTEHISAAMLGGNVTVGGSGLSEFHEYITAGKMRAIAVTSEQRLKGVDIPTMKEQGYNVVLGNWRGVFGANGITPAQRKALTDMIVTATRHKSWQEALERNGWTPAVLTGPAFDDFVDTEFATLRAIMAKSGMV